MTRPPHSDDAHDSRTAAAIEAVANALSSLGEGLTVSADHIDWLDSPLLHVNDAMCQLTGLGADALIGRTPRSLMAGEVDPPTLDRLRQELSAGRTAGATWMCHCQDGATYEGEWVVAPMLGPDGRRVQYVGVHHNVTERERLKAESRQREDRLQTVLTTASDAIVRTDQAGTILSVNPATERMFGFRADELVGQNVRVLMPSPFREEHDTYIQRFLRTREPRIIGVGREVVARRQDGSTFPVDLAVSEVDHLGEFTGILRDISQRKELQRQVLEAAAAEKRRIGHELHDGTGQELTGLTLMARTLTDLLLASPRQEADGRWRVDEAPLRQVRQIADRLVAGLADAHRHVRELSRGLIPVQIEGEGLWAALQQLAASTNSAGAVRCRLDSPEPVSVARSLAATQLFRIAQEAVTNAQRHGRATEIVISLRSTAREIVLEIADDGIGISEPPPTPPRPASVGDRPESGERGARIGAGVGLGIMQYRAGVIGGTLRVGRRAKGGTLVRCVVPVVP